MINEQRIKVMPVINPVIIKDDAAFVTNIIDCAGFDFVAFYLMLGATDIAMAVLKMQECDTIGGSYTDVTGLIFGTSENTAGDTSALPTALEDGLIFGFEVDLRKRKRFLDLSATMGDGTVGGYAVAWANLSRASEELHTAAGRGCEQILRV